MSIASRIEQIEQHIENAYESIGNKGVDLRDKLNIDLKGNTSQEVVSGEVGLEVENTSIYVDDVNEDKENYVTLKGNTYQATTTGKNLYEGSQNFSGTWTNQGNWETDSSTYNGLVVKKRKTAWQGLSKTINVEAGKTYTYSLFIKSDSARSVAIYTDGGTATISPLNKSITTTTSWARYSLTFTCSASGTIKARLENTTASDSNYTYICGYQLEESSSMTNYEPYTNGASPNPDYPQEIEVVTGLNEVVVEGKNLFDENNQQQVVINNVTGTKRYGIIVNAPNKKVSISGNFVADIAYRLITNDVYHSYIQITQNTTVDVTEKICIYVGGAGIKLSDQVRNLQIEISDTPTTYEAYKGQTYEVNLGKNLFDKSTIVTNKYIDENGELGSSNNFSATDYIQVIGGETYTYSGCHMNTTWASGGAYYNSSKVFISSFKMDSVATTITPPSNAKYVRFSLRATENDQDTFMFEKGNKATSYAPYFTPIELCKIGTYQDRIYKSNGNWYLHKEIGKVVLDGTGYWGSASEGDTTNGFSIFTTTINNILEKISKVLYCDMFKYIPRNELTSSSINFVLSGSENVVVLNIDRTLLSEETTTGFKNWLNTSQPLLYYPLQTPTDTQITDTTLISQLNALYNATIYSTTHINTETSNLLPYINLKYNVVTASPSPDRASEVEVVTGNNAIKIQSKNLFDIPLENGSSNGVTWTVNENGSITLNGTSTNHININSSSLNIPVTEGETYTISATNILAGNIGFKELNGTDIWVLSKYSLTKTKIITSDMQTTNVKFSIYIPPNNTFNNVTITFQLEKGNQATSYVPYQSQSYNITLGNLELCKIGDYQDYFYKDNGNWYKYSAIGKVVLNGSEDWTNPDTYQEIRQYQAIKNDALYVNDTITRILSNYYKGVGFGNSWTKDNTITIAYNKVIRVMTSKYTTVNDFKNWLSTHNTTCYYVLATPIITQITDTILINQLNALADARKYEDGIETIINQTNSGLSFEIETNPTHLNRNIENISTEIDKIETTEWKPQPDWWDIKTIIKDDEENYPYKIIALQDEGAKTLNIEIDSLFAAKKVKLSDGQEITTSGLYTVNEEGLKSCSKGYKTFYSIWYFNDIPNFSYNSIGHFFRNSRYIYFYNIGNINLNSSFSWVSNQNRLLEAVESNKQITTALSNESFRIIQANCLRKIPDWIFCRNGNIHSPNTIGFSIAPYIKYKDMTKIINSRNFDFTSGTAPEITNSFLDETIDFENDWGMPTTLFTTTSSIIGPYAIQKMDFENVTSFKGTLNVSEVYEVYNIKISNNYFTGEMLSHDTLVRVLNALYNYSDSEDIYTLTLGTVNLAKLTAEEIAIGTDKGWTIN